MKNPLYNRSYSRPLLLCIVLSSLVWSVWPTPTVGADSLDQGTCTITENYINGTAPVAQGGYNVFLKSDLPSADSPTTVMAMSGDGASDVNCQSIGSIAAQSEKWTLLGSYEVKQDIDVTFFAGGAGPVSQADLNRIRIRLVPISTSQLCDMNAVCSQQLPGEIRRTIQPASTQLAESELVIERVVDPSSDTVSYVDYYADEKLLYTAEELRDFNLNDPNVIQATALTRIAHYDSGQRVIYEAATRIAQPPSFLGFVQALFNPYSDVLKAVFLLLGVMIVLMSIKAFVVIYKRRRRWALDHGFVTDRQVSDSGVVSKIQNAITTISNAIESLFGYVKYIFFITLIALLVLLYIGEVLQVSGKSMRATYEDHQFVVVNKIPVTLAALKSGFYTPQRGDVAIFKAGVQASEGQVNLGMRNATMIKRVIGLPGERVRIMDGVTTIYNTANPDGFNPESGSEWANTIIKDDRPFDIDITVGKDQVFIVGDNRRESIDSRIIGPVDLRQMLGTVTYDL